MIKESIDIIMIQKKEKTRRKNATKKFKNTFFMRILCLSLSLSQAIFIMFVLYFIYFFPMQ